MPVRELPKSYNLLAWGADFSRKSPCPHTHSTILSVSARTESSWLNMSPSSSMSSIRMMLLCSISLGEKQKSLGAINSEGMSFPITKYKHQLFLHCHQLSVEGIWSKSRSWNLSRRKRSKRKQWALSLLKKTEERSTPLIPHPRALRVSLGLDSFQ